MKSEKNMSYTPSTKAILRQSTVMEKNTNEFGIVQYHQFSNGPRETTEALCGAVRGLRGFALRDVEIARKIARKVALSANCRVKFVTDKVKIYEY